MRWDDRIGRRLKLRDISVLMAVAQSGSMAKAARELAVSQPVVSKTISDLEHILGVRLLDRSPQGVSPTPFGRALLNRGVAVFDELRLGIKEIEFLADPTVGDVRVGASSAMVDGFLPVVVARLCRQYPRLTIEVQILSGSALPEGLRERTVDFVVARISTPIREPDLSAEILFEDPQLVIVGAKNPLAQRRKVKLPELVDDPWILPRSGSVAGALIADTFHACGLEVPRAAVSCDSFQMTGALLGAGRYLAMFPRSLLKFSGWRRSVKVLPVTLPNLPRPVGVVTLKGRIAHPAAQLFIDRMREDAKTLVQSNDDERL